MSPTSQRRRIFLMRHGSVTYFDASGKPFLPETVPLNEQGCAQASAAGRAFAAEGIQFDRVIVSGLPRTVETATRVLAATGQGIDIEIWPEFEEIRGGRLSTIADADLKEAFTGAFDGMAGEDKRFLGGESVGQLMDRIHPAVARLRGQDDWDTALLVLHGGVNCAILSLALTGQRMFLGGLAQTAGCINALDVGDGEADWVVRFVNYSPPAPLQTETRCTTMEQLYEQYRLSR
ncbi:histidine phosphatase family protein [Massilia antarctica]|uniref:histidine phosphatase family protein n=1 Tax=Massilia antarctica TaxID=2765360 RepID=UPI0006BB5761|nr:histidine phosphatase family protein [Massilia sp. H27-R4]MCY0910439.1 histidine phosphatase family protein [Massilia sp. H27-R4]CUI09213.1 Alpha-ribazole-5'-phosphate phosphatase [Janthinobacterium sp. CG23_2]CUU32999.1 Alpha-ribazole-5'-phosphate phosphatase [Janthinobacterium sp. CG23_2]